MEISQEEISVDEVNQQDKQQGRKRKKVEQQQEQMLKLDFRSIIKEKFDPQQVKHLIDNLKGLENYYKFISFEIQHQERSIATLPPSILSSFPELKNRVQTMIQKAKHNVEFLDLVLMPYKPLVFEALLTEKRRADSEDSDQVGHNHTCSNHNTISNMFYHIVREWGANSELEYCSKILNYLEKHVFSQYQKDRKLKILVVGSGMGRILHEIRKRFQSYSIQLQGHETDTELYLCGQYFLNRCTKAHGIYPYLHNFCNFLSNSDPYRCINVPALIDDHSYYYPLTLGSYTSIYKTHQNNWDVIISIFNNYHIDNILTNLKLIYKMLKNDGYWLDLSTSNFDRNIIPFGYRQFENVLDRSQFKLLEKAKEKEFWYGDKSCLMNEMRVNYYRIMKK